MIIPAATYRLQFSGKYTFKDLQQALEYLQLLGISTVYASPIFRARKGSTHGYDVLDPYTINPEIGSLESFRVIQDTLKKLKMSWLQDIVPNHMAFSAENPWLKDIFELGPDSEHYHFFDIDWNSSRKLMAPVLGGSLEEVVMKGELQLQLEGNAFYLNYFQHKFPVSARSYSFILKDAGVGKWINKFADFSGNDMQWEDLRIGFFREVQEKIELQKGIKSVLEQINSSSEKMHALLELQYFELVPWQQTDQKINYRRFFTINDLICLNVQDPQVFESYHYYLKELCEQGLINGLRIDHIDGLFDPAGYLRNLRNFIQEDLYVVVEKIQETEEQLPQDWPVQGSTGYDFLVQLNHLFTKQENEQTFSETYSAIAPEYADHEKLVFEKKLFILREKMGGELENLLQLIWDYGLLQKEGEQTENNYRKALSSFMASFPVYRIYPEGFPLKTHEQEIINAAYSKAVQRTSGLEQELKVLKSIFQGDSEGDPEKKLVFLQRCQQFTGPLAAKGVEDTVFYIYNRLISHNEVGDSPENFGMGAESFHEKMKLRQQKYPLSLNATATHDTKRGEDARMRLNVLSELPEEWFSKFGEWQQLNAGLKDNEVPGPNEEYFIYQSLLGALPFDEEEMEEFPSRLKDYLQKAFREAKVHTDWGNPDEAYESAISDFASALLESEEFMNSFRPFQEKIAFYGVLKSLGQTLLKITAPGIPDIYQGTELWDLSFVDPDNRRAVDYTLRRSQLLDLNEIEKDDLKSKLKELQEVYKDARIKMFLLNKALHFRKEHKKLFEEGAYIPLQLSGNSGGSFIAYARNFEEQWAIVVAPVMVTGIFEEGELIPQKAALEDHQITLPGEAPKNWRNCLTGAEIDSNKGLDLKVLLEDLPVALLTNVEKT